jgi:hypothetical protein
MVEDLEPYVLLAFTTPMRLPEESAKEEKDGRFQAVNLGPHRDAGFTVLPQDDDVIRFSAEPGGTLAHCRSDLALTINTGDMWVTDLV